MASATTTKWNIDQGETADLLRRLNTLPKDLRATENGRMRDAAGEAGEGLRRSLVAAASGAGRQARAVAPSAKVRRDRIVSVKVGGRGNFRPKRSKGDAPRYGAILWGSDKGGRRFPNARPWIDPGVTTYANGPLPRIYEAALADVFRANGLL